MDFIECSNCEKELFAQDDILTDDHDKCFCNDRCYREYISGLVDYMQMLGED